MAPSNMAVRVTGLDPNQIKDGFKNLEASSRSELLDAADPRMHMGCVVGVSGLDIHFLLHGCPLASPAWVHGLTQTDQMRNWLNWQSFHWRIWQKLQYSLIGGIGARD